MGEKEGRNAKKVFEFFFNAYFIDGNKENIMKTLDKNINWNGSKVCETGVGKEEVKKILEKKVFNYKKINCNLNNLKEVIYFDDFIEYSLYIKKDFYVSCMLKRNFEKEFKIIKVNIKNYLNDQILKDTKIALENSKLNYWIYYMKKNEVKFLNIQEEFSHFKRNLKNYPEILFEKKMIHLDDVKDYREAVKKIKFGVQDKIIWKSRLLNKDGKYLWRRYKFLVIYNKNKEREYAIGISEDIENEIKVSKINSTVFDQMGIFSWTYNIREKEITTNNKLEKTHKGEPINKVIKNVPDSLFKKGLVKGSEEIKKVRTFFENIDNGKVYSSSKLYLFNLYTKRYGWYQANMTIIEWEEGKPKKAIGSIYEITHEVLVKRNFEEALKIEKEEKNYQLESYVPGAYTICIWNLSKNKLHSQKGYNWLIKKLSPSEQTFENFLKGIGKSIVEKKHREEFTEKYSIKNLFEMYGEKKNDISFTLAYNSYLGKIWAKSNLYFIKDPTTQDLFLKITNENISNKVIKDQIINTIVKNEFEYIANIDEVLDKCFIISDEDEKVYTTIEYKKRLCNEVEIDEKSSEGFFREIYKKIDKNGVYEKTFTLKNKKVKLITVYILDRINRGYCVLCSDITELTKYEKEQKRKLLEAKKIAEKANSLKSDFFARMSHDMRTPLNSIISFSEFGIIEKRDEKDVEYFNQIKESSEYLLGLLNDILSMRKIESGKIEITPEIICVDEFLENILNIARPKAEAKKINLEIKINTSFCKYQKFDKLRVMQIVLNILSNAIKYTGVNGKVVWNKWFKIDVKNKTYFHNEIEDNGAGMSEEFLKKVFEPFSQEKNEFSNKEPGSGLGLAITKRLIEILGGKIWCKSVLGKGTTFYFDIPIENVTEKEYLEYSKDKNVIDKEIKLTNKRILLCEDNEINAKIIIKLLENKGMVAKWVKNGFEGVEEAKHNYYDIILMDIRMPILDGLEATKKIRKFNNNIPIVALSANAYPEDISKSLQVGMNSHLPKPINFNTFYDTLELVIR